MKHQDAGLGHASSTPVDLKPISWEVNQDWGREAGNSSGQASGAIVESMRCAGLLSPPSQTSASAGLGERP